MLELPLLGIASMVWMGEVAGGGDKSGGDRGGGKERGEREVDMRWRGSRLAGGPVAASLVRNLLFLPSCAQELAGIDSTKLLKTDHSFKSTQISIIPKVDVSKLPQKLKEQLNSETKKVNEGGEVSIPLSDRLFAGHLLPRPNPTPVPPTFTKPYTGRGPATLVMSSSVQASATNAEVNPLMMGQQQQYVSSLQWQQMQLQQQQYPQSFTKNQSIPGLHPNAAAPQRGAWVSSYSTQGGGRPLGEAFEVQSYHQQQYNLDQQQQAWSQWQQQLATTGSMPQQVQQQLQQQPASPISWVEHQSFLWQQQERQRLYQLSLERLQQGNQPQQTVQNLPYLDSQREQQLQQYIKAASQTKLPQNPPVYGAPSSAPWTAPGRRAGNGSPLSWVEEQSLVWQAQHPFNDQATYPGGGGAVQPQYIVQHQPLPGASPIAINGFSGQQQHHHQNLGQHQLQNGAGLAYGPAATGSFNTQGHYLKLPAARRYHHQAHPNEEWPLNMRPPFPQPVAQPSHDEEWHAGDDDIPEFRHEDLLDEVVGAWCGMGMCGLPFQITVMGLT